jgi:hypothetical protein
MMCQSCKHDTKIREYQMCENFSLEKMYDFLLKYKDKNFKK